MLTTIDGTESLPREANLPDSLVSQTTEPDTSQRKASNGCLFIHRLPTEIFIHFIALVLADHRPDSNPAKVYTRVGELKLVCVLWADRINSYPRFWDVLTNRLGPGLVSAVLKRSRAVTMHVEITPNHDIWAYITVIKSCAHRWITLNISWVGVNEAILCDLLQVPAPQLQKLSIAGSNATPTTAIHLFGGQAPLLHTVTITPNEWNIVRPIIPRLKHLTVDAIHFPARQTSQLELDMVIQALTASPEIEVLKFCNLGHQFVASAEALTIPSSPILLSRLRSITFDQVFSEGAFKFFAAAIRFPHNCALNIRLHVLHRPGSLNTQAVLSILYARFTQVVPLGIDIQITPWKVSIVLGYGRDGAGRMEITVDSETLGGHTHIKGFVEQVLHQLGEAIRASSISVHLRIGRKGVDGSAFPCEDYISIVETVDGLLPSTTRASIYGTHFAEFIDYAESGFVNLSELIIEETRIGAPWMQLVEVAKSRLCEAAEPGSRVVALRSISLPSKGLDKAARERLSRVAEQLNWTDDPHA